MYRLAALFSLFLFISLPSTAFGQSPEKPRLTVVMVIDQFRADFISRYRDLFVDGGINRLLNEGAWFKDATYGHMHASTSSGHSVITSGTYGYRSGIIANSWYDRRVGAKHNSMADPEHRILGKPLNPVGRSSPRDIHGSTLSDELRKSTGFTGKYFSTSVKDYSAMVSAGKSGIPLWYEASLGRFTTSDYYMDQVPEWVARFNARERPDSFFGKQWKRLLMPEIYRQRVGLDARPNEENNRSAGITFPHTITGGEDAPGVAFWNSLKHTPWGDELVLEFARTLISEEDLGQDDTPDILVVSLGSVDYIGHDYGPISQESMDGVLRVDRQIERFLTYLDETVGMDHTLLVLTGDHGAVPLSEESVKQGTPSARVSPAELTSHVEAVLDSAFGADDWIEAMYQTGLYLNYETVDGHGLSREAVARVSAEALSSHPGISSAITRARILKGDLPDTPLSRRITNSFFPDRSGDVIPVAEPFYLVFDEYSEKPMGSSHGQPHAYDVHVPLVFHGRWIESGIHRYPVDMADVAPTICEILGLSMPSGRDGAILDILTK